MTSRISVTVLALAVLIGSPGLSAASPHSPVKQLPADGAAPLQLPPAAPSEAAPAPAPQPGSGTAPAAPSTATGTTAEPEAPAQGQPDEEDDGDMPADSELSLGEIPIIETVELTPDLAQRALDSYIAAREKYVDSDLEQYENLQDFVDQTDDGKKFEADVKAAGFANVTDWNLAITTLGLTYGSVVDDQTPDLRMQIEEVKQDTEMAQDIKDRMVKALEALIPSDNNRKVIEDLLNDPVYGPKLKLLDIEEE